MEEVKTHAPIAHLATEKSGLIYELIPKIMAELDPIGRDQVNKEQKFKFRGIDDAYNALAPLLAKHRVFTVPLVHSAERRDVTSRSGSRGVHAFLDVTYRLYGPDGSFFETRVQGEGVDYGDKSTSKALSIAHKYALTQIFMFRTADQQKDEPDSESPDIGDSRHGKENRSESSRSNNSRATTDNRKNSEPPSRTRNAISGTGSHAKRDSQPDSSAPTGSKTEGKKVNQAQVKSILDIGAEKGITQQDIIQLVKETKGYENLYQLTEGEGRKLYDYLCDQSAKPAARNLVTAKQIERLWAIAGEKGIDKETVHNRIWEDFGLESTKDLDQKQYNQLCAEMMK